MSHRNTSANAEPTGTFYNLQGEGRHRTTDEPRHRVTQGRRTLRPSASAPTTLDRRPTSQIMRSRPASGSFLWRTRAQRASAWLCCRMPTGDNSPRSPPCLAATWSPPAENARAPGVEAEMGRFGLAALTRRPPTPKTRATPVQGGVDALRSPDGHQGWPYGTYGGFGIPAYPRNAAGSIYPGLHSPRTPSRYDIEASRTPSSHHCGLPASPNA